jgi:hypothetical protein
LTALLHRHADFLEAPWLSETLRFRVNAPLFLLRTAPKIIQGLGPAAQPTTLGPTELWSLSYTPKGSVVFPPGVYSAAASLRQALSDAGSSLSHERFFEMTPAQTTFAELSRHTSKPGWVQSFGLVLPLLTLNEKGIQPVTWGEFANRLYQISDKDLVDTVLHLA